MNEVAGSIPAPASMAEFKVGCSPLTKKLYAGTVLKDGMWGKKHDVTDTAPGAVAEFLLFSNLEMEFNCMGEDYVLKVEKLKPSDESKDE